MEHSVLFFLKEDDSNKVSMFVTLLWKSKIEHLPNDRLETREFNNASFLFGFCRPTMLFLQHTAQRTTFSQFLTGKQDRNRVRKTLWLFMFDQNGSKISKYFGYGT